jgi:hypothetical protein
MKADNLALMWYLLPIKIDRSTWAVLSSEMLGGLTDTAREHHEFG